MSSCGRKGGMAFSGVCKLIVADIDGTFVTAEKHLIPANVQAVRLAAAKGVPFVFATGRAWTAISDWAIAMGLEEPQIASNGALLVEPQSGHVFSRITMEPKVIRFFAERFIEAGFSPVLGGVMGDVAPRQDHDTDLRLLPNHEPYTVVSLPKIHEAMDAGIFRMVVISFEREAELIRLSAQLAVEAQALGYEFSHGFTEKGTSVFSAGNASKLKSIGLLCEKLHCTLADVMAFGDGDNDAEMLAGVGLGIAMGNATEKTKRAAAVVLEKNNEEAGVAWAIRKYVLGEK